MKKGFTLAEVLITLGVIGVVAALTLPNVLQNFRERTYVASLQKAYNSVSNAVVGLMAAEQVDDLGQSSLANQEGLDKFLYKYLKVVKDCGTSTGDCINGSYETVERTSSYSPYNIAPQYSGSMHCVVLDSGAGVCASPYSTYFESAIFMIDTNATKGPNINGRDFWVLIANADGRVGGSANLASYAPSPGLCSGYSYTCASYVMANGWQMKY